MFSMKTDEQLFINMDVWMRTGENDKVKFIIKHTKPTELANKNGVTLLHLAALNGNLNIMEHLKDMGCELDCKTSSNQTPLNLAISNRHWEAVKYLLKHNVDIFAKNLDGRSPLSELISDYTPDFEVLQIFLDKIKKKSASKGELLRILRVYGCRLTNVIHLHDAEITEMFLQLPNADVSEPSVNKCWSVEVAMRSMDEENMRVLLYCGLSVANRRQDFMFGMLNVLRDNYRDKSLDVVLKVAIQQLVKWKFLVNGNPIIILESMYREAPAECLRKLLDDDLVSYIKTDFGYDIRLQIFGNCCDEVLNMIKNGEADMNAISRKGRTALHIATQTGTIETMKYLLESGMSPNITDDDGNTPIFKVHYDSNFNYEESLELLLLYKADLQATNNSGRTYIESYRSPEFSHYLIKIAIAHLAILEVSGVPLKKPFRTYVLASEETLDYFQSCCQQLERIKTLQVHSSLTLFEVLTENLKNLIRRVRSIDHETIDIFFSTGTTKEFDSHYVLSSMKLLHWAVKMGNLRDKAAVVISESIEVLKPYNLVIEKICSYLSYHDLRAFDE